MITTNGEAAIGIFDVSFIFIMNVGFRYSYELLILKISLLHNISHGGCHLGCREV